ncbi:MAG: hypothetical protein GTN65_12110, partial [Armatimonadetes bacterium]|nr:hypothetical protein [Armatimonadota bacterium]NIO97811.1 hypothetical protein [Armatimonadota bacterium]
EHRIRRTVLISAVAVLVVAALYVAGTYLFCGLITEAEWCAFWPHFTTDSIKGYIRDAGPWGVAVSMGLMVLHSFIPFPAEVIAIANGMIYGVLWGTVITWTGAMM